MTNILLKTINISLLNTQSLNNNPELIKSIIEENNIDIMCLTETWANRQIANSPTNYTPTFKASTPNTYYF